MIDPRALLHNRESTIQKLEKRGCSAPEVVTVAGLLESKATIQLGLESLRAESNKVRAEFQRSLGTATSNSKHPPERLSEIKNEIIRAEREQKSIAQLADSQILTLPNIPDEVSLSVTESFTIREVKGSISPAAIAPHWDIAERLGYADSSRATKISGGGFLVLMNDGAKLLRQLRDLGVELLRSRYREVSLPHLVREESMYGSGHLPKFSNGSYKVSDEPLWLSPTAEVPLTSIHRNETIPVEKLTLRYVSALTCFRREVGNGGAASQWRLHEYDQVELMRICTHGAVEQEYSELLQDSTKVLDLLDITYRVVRLSPIDLPFSASRAHRIDVYSPGTQMWLPVSSASLFSDYQARRSNIRIKDAKGTTFATTMNSSALAASRLWGILLENGLQKDGTVMLPAALHERMGTNVLLPS